MIDSTLWLGILAGFTAGILIAFWFMRQKLSRNDKEYRDLQIKYHQLEARYQSEMRAWEEKLQFASRSREEMSAQFRSLADKILEEKEQGMSKTHSERMTRILEPFQQQLNLFRKQVEQSYHFRLQDSAQLKTQIQQLTQLNQQISQDALNLTKALKGQSQTQGYWGEMILEKVLEQSGLVKGDHYETQVSMETEDRQRLRPDAIVHLPEEKDIVVDAKVSLNAYEEYSSTDSEARREEALKAHLRSVRAHLKELDIKDYSRLPGVNSIDLVLMFIPVEGAFSLALQQDRSLFSDAFDRRIIIVSPTTLFATLRTVESSWKKDAQSRNAQEIARKAGLLYDKFCSFLNDLDKLEKALDQAGKAYYDARNKLSDGRGNLIRKTEELRELGARTSKKLPSDLIN